MLDGALAAALLQDTAALAVAIRAAVASYGTSKAIFTGALPDGEDAAFPAIVIAQTGGADFGCRVKKGAEVSIDVQVFGDKATSLATVRGIAKNIWDYFNRAEIGAFLTAAGFEDWGVTARPPQNTQDGLGFPGFTIQVTARVLKT